MTPPVSPSAALTAIVAAQATRIASKTGKFTAADLAPFMAEARALHAGHLSDADPPLGLDLAEWAVLGIAMNLLSRSRGYDPASEQRTVVRVVSALDPIKPVRLVGE